MARYTEEQCRELQSANLVDFVQSHGFVCKKAGREIHVEGFGGLYINPENNSWYCHSDGVGGYGITGGKTSFAERYLNMKWYDVMRERFGEPTGEWIPSERSTVCQTYEAQQFVEQEVKKELIMPEADDNTKNVYAYLAYTRGLSSKIINDFIQKGLIYQQKGTHNAVFVHIDDNGVIRGADTRGTCSDVQYRGIVTGSDMNYGFEYTRGTAEKVYVFEAAIDMMSFMQLHPEIQNAKFVSMCGLKPKVIEKYINDGIPVISCVDNDEAGQDFNNKILCSVLNDGLNLEHKEEKIFRGRKPPIRYVLGSNEGKSIGFFLSKQDYVDMVTMEGSKPESAFILINKSSFQICNECRDYQCKDFNDLLKKKQNFNAYKSNVKSVVHSLVNNKDEISKSGQYGIEK